VLTGYAAQSVGTTPTLIAGAFLPLIAVGLLAAAGQWSHDRKALPLSSGAAPSANRYRLGLERPVLAEDCIFGRPCLFGKGDL